MVTNHVSVFQGRHTSVYQQSNVTTWDWWRFFTW